MGCGLSSHLYRQARRPEEMRAMIMKARRDGQWMFFKVLERSSVSIFDNKSQIRKIEIRIDKIYNKIFFLNNSGLINVI